MGMPQIPEGKHRPNWDETVIDLLESIALEEMAIAHLMNAEGERVQAMVKGYHGQEISYAQMQQSCDHSRGLMNSMIMKEWLLYNKLTTVLELTPWEEIPSSPTVPDTGDNGERTCQREGQIRIPTTIKHPCG